MARGRATRGDVAAQRRVIHLTDQTETGPAFDDYHVYRIASVSIPWR